MSFSLPSIFLVFLSQGLASFVASPLAGPDVPAPKHLSESVAFQNALSKVEKATQQSLNSSWDDYTIPSNNVSFAVDLFSIHEEQPYLEYFHDGSDYANASEGTSSVDENTIFRLGSISKLYTVYVSLIADGKAHWNDPITNYIPELAAYMEMHRNSDDSLNTIDFDAITLADLASQISGLPRDNSYGPNDDPGLAQTFGLPPTNQSIPANISNADCPNPINVPCTRGGYFENFISKGPLFSAAYEPAYSNIAYGLFAMAYENITGKSFEVLFEENLVQNLNLSSTFYQAPPSSSLSNAIIPINDSVADFSVSLSYGTPAGGYYSSLADLRKISRAMLSSTLLPKSVTNVWMKPRSFTSNPLQAVGAPWEIFTYNPSSGRRVDLYTKGGAIGLYQTLTVLIPLYDVGFNILAAGAENAIAQRTLSAILPAYILDALEEAAHEEAYDTYAGTYVNAATNSTIVLSRSNLPYNQSGPGLNMTEYTFGGYNMFDALAMVAHGSTPPSQQQIRLVPTSLTSANGTVEGWRSIAYSEPNYALAAARHAVISTGGPGGEWFNLDALSYGGKAFDNFHIRLDPSGKAVGITPQIFSSTEYTRQP